MVYEPDMTKSGKFKLVGYLSRDHDYPQGEISEAAFDRLANLALLRIIQYLGYYNCDLGSCGSNQIQPDFYWRGMRIPQRCTSEILVPGKAVLYRAPALILHYIRAHRYLPPARFLDAVLACPEPGSDEYRRVISDYRLPEGFQFRQRSWLQRLLRINK